MSNEHSLPDFLTAYDYYPGMCLVNQDDLVTSEPPAVLEGAMNDLMNESN